MNSSAKKYAVLASVLCGLMSQQAHALDQETATAVSTVAGCATGAVAGYVTGVALTKRASGARNIAGIFCVAGGAAGALAAVTLTEPSAVNQAELDVAAEESPVGDSAQQEELRQDG